MSARRSELLPRFCSRRRSGMNLSYAEVNGIYAIVEANANKARKTKISKRLAISDQTIATRLTSQRNGKKKKKKKNRRKKNRSDRMKLAEARFVVRLEEAEAVEDRGDYGKAEFLYNELICLCKRDFRIGRHELAFLYHDLARLHLCRDRLELAKILFEKSLEVFVRTVGVEHRYTRTVRADLAALASGRDCGASARKGTNSVRAY